MYVIKVLGWEHKGEDLQDIFVELIRETEQWYLEYMCCEFGTEEDKTYKRNWKAYERACLECFRLAILRK